MIRFRFTSALFFLTFAVAVNLLITPLLTAAGMSEQASLFLVNSLAGGVGVTVVVLYFEKRYKHPRQALFFFLGSLAVCTAASYYLVFL